MRAVPGDRVAERLDFRASNRGDSLSHSVGNGPHGARRGRLVRTPAPSKRRSPGAARADPGARVRPADQQRRRGADRQFGSVPSRRGRVEAWRAESPCRPRQPPMARSRSLAGRAHRVPGPRPLHYALLVRDQAGDRQSRADLELHDGPGEGPGEGDGRRLARPADRGADANARAAPRALGRSATRRPISSPCSAARSSASRSRSST